MKLPRVMRPGAAAPWWEAAAKSIDDLMQMLNPQTNFTVATLPDATKNEGRQVYVSDETGGATLAFSNGTDWVRAYDPSTVIS